MSLIVATSCWLSKLIINPYKGFSIHPPKWNTIISFSCSKGDKPIRKTFNTPHPPKDPPENYNPLCVTHKAFDVPDFIPAAVFRPFSSDSEKLGPGADKRGVYKNPEYYAYHRYSFITLQVLCLKLSEKSKKQE